jgi:hypothetical protein
MQMTLSLEIPDLAPDLAADGFGSWECAFTERIQRSRSRVFTVDDVRDMPGPRDGRWWGLAMARAHRAGLIRPRGVTRSRRTPDAPRYLVTTWEAVGG